MQTNMQSPMAAPKSKVWLWIVVVAAVVIIAASAWWWYTYYYQPAPIGTSPAAGVSAPLSGGDTTADIEKDLGAVDLGSVEQEVNQLDSDINQL